MTKAFWVGFAMLLAGIGIGLVLAASTIEGVNVAGDHRFCIREN